MTPQYLDKLIIYMIWGRILIKPRLNVFIVAYSDFSDELDCFVHINRFLR
jgi:hypothetical protein